MKILHVSHFTPSPTGHGGNHRTYQIQQELAQGFGAENVVFYDFMVHKAALHGSSKLLTRPTDLLFALKKYAKFWLGNPYRTLGKTYFSPNMFAYQAVLQHYQSILTKIQPTLVIIEHLGMGDIVQINRAHNVPTLALPHNIESLDAGFMFDDSNWHLPSRLLDFANELAVLQQCDATFVIAQTETNMLRGLGFAVQHYAYRPVTKLRKQLLNIRQQRAQNSIEANTFLVMGTAAHGSTGEGIGWLLEQVRRYGLPDGTKIMLVGDGTDTLLRHFPISDSDVEALGWVEQDKLDALLTKITAVLVPQFRGFGSLTRLTELACAGISVITTPHALSSVTPLTGFYEVENPHDWASWLMTMRNISANQGCPLADYLAWDAEQSSLFGMIKDAFGTA